MTAAAPLHITSDLWHMKKGQKGIILGYTDNLAPAIQERLAELGYRPEALVQCTVTPRLGAPKFYRTANSIYSLERDVAEHIKVEIQLG